MLTQAGISSSTMQLEINLILSAWQLMIAVLRSAFAGKIGRRPLALLILGSCTVCFYLPEGLTARFEDTANTAGIYGTIACIFLFLGTYSFGLTPLTAMYAPEILPYSMRASGIALRGILVKICGVFVVSIEMPATQSDARDWE